MWLKLYFRSNHNSTFIFDCTFPCTHVHLDPKQCARHSVLLVSVSSCMHQFRIEVKIL